MRFINLRFTYLLNASAEQLPVTRLLQSRVKIMYKISCRRRPAHSTVVVKTVKLSIDACQLVSQAFCRVIVIKELT